MGITRRDFLDGVAIGTGLGLLSPMSMLGSAADISGAAIEAPYYPPTATGMRGSHVGSFEVAHALAWRGEKPSTYKPLDEHYDLVVVGAGLSGLAAAHYFRKKAGTDVRILILDNHDDFGGHAKRNEFHYNNRMVISLGGAQNLENPGAYSENAKNLLADLGVDQTYIDNIAEQTPKDFVLGGNLTGNVSMALPRGGQHDVVNGHWTQIMLGAEGYADAIRQLPLAETQKDIFISFVGGKKDYLDDLSIFASYDYLNSTSYNEFLTQRVGLSEETLAITDAQLLIYHGHTGWNLSVLEAIASGSPGLNAIGWLGRQAAKAVRASLEDAIEVRMFPDGNASVARLLVHQLVPSVDTNMKGAEDVASARFDYSKLDLDDAENRIRLNSTAVGVAENTSGRVDIDYVQDGEALRVTADKCILACYNGIIPKLCPQLPEVQKEALTYGVKVPFVYANVLLKDGHAFSKLDSTLVQCPRDPFQWMSAAPTMTTGGYEPPRSPQDPMAVFMMSAPTAAPQGSESLKDLLRLGRHKIYATPFSTYEAEIRQQLQSVLGKYGFDHSSDIEAITVNRIPHGYAYAYLALEDPQWPEGQAPHEIGRAKFGNISIANSDSEAMAYMDAAFDAAWRAVEEQTA